MEVAGLSVLVTGGASGLGRASAELLAKRGAKVTIVDLPGSAGEEAAAALATPGRFVAADVADADQMAAAFTIAAEDGPLRAVVHCAGRGAPLRLIDREGNPGSLETFEQIVRINLIGSFNVLRLAAAAMNRADPIGEERGVVVLTASIAAYEGQIGQIPYASSKAGIVGMTLVAARDLANRAIRVCAIAPGIFNTPPLQRANPALRQSLSDAIPNPKRMGEPPEFAMLAAHIIENPMLNGETIRIDGAMRMAAK